MIYAKPGKENTEKTIEIALKAAREQGITDVVVASRTGATAQRLQDSGLNVVCVTHVYGFVTPGENEMDDAVRRQLADAGVAVLSTAHALSGAERGISGQAGGMYPVEVMAATLRMFGQGVKVCVECATMALDAGLVPHGKKILALGGTGFGADTAVVLTPAYSSGILGTKIHEILCKPQ